MERRPGTESAPKRARHAGPEQFFNEAQLAATTGLLPCTRSTDHVQGHAPTTSAGVASVLEGDASVIDFDSWDFSAAEPLPSFHGESSANAHLPPDDMLRQTQHMPAADLQTTLTTLGNEPDIWTDTALFSLPTWPITITEDAASRNRKRVREIAQLDADEATYDDHLAPGNVEMMRDSFPIMFPSVPLRSTRPIDGIANPFFGDHQERFTTLDTRILPQLPTDGRVDGYIKIQFSHMPGDDNLAAPPSVFKARVSRASSSSTQQAWIDDRPFETLDIPTLPPNFATGLKLDAIDRKLWAFHLYAYCPGRMLLAENYWCDDLLPMAVSDPGARHALFAFTTSYALDYQPTEEMRQRANFHYRNAVEYLSQALSKAETYQVGKGDAAIAATILVFSADIVNWETRRPKGQVPLWLEGARVARSILARTDPGYQYWVAENVQSSLVYRAQANWVAYVCILAQPVMPLPIDTGNVDTGDALDPDSFKWLLEGTKEEVHQVHGITGLCPKLLHIFGQITHLAARIVKNPAAEMVVKMAGDRLAARLGNFWQWSALSHGHQSFDELMASCHLDDNGTVSDSATVTELTAYAWVPTAELYLSCRVYRKPRSHPDVLKQLNRLALCIRRLPSTGPLFTSQSPFFPVVIMALVSQLPRHRRVVQNWFGTVLEGAQCRSSVPPVWEAIQNCWQIMDAEDESEELSDDKARPLQDRDAWWERMVEVLMADAGVLSLV